MFKIAGCVQSECLTGGVAPRLTGATPADLPPPLLPHTARQPATAGLLPPSDSDSDDSGPRGQNPRAGLMPSSSSDDDDDDDDDGDDGDDNGDAPAAAAAGAAPTEPRKSAKQRKADAEAAAINLERLRLVRERRERERTERIAAEGWDRFAPESETNRRPVVVPKDHPSLKAEEEGE